MLRQEEEELPAGASTGEESEVRNVFSCGKEVSKVTLVGHWRQQASSGDYGYMEGHCTIVSTFV